MAPRSTEKLPWRPFSRFYGPAERGMYGPAIVGTCKQEVDVNLSDVAEVMGVSKRAVVRYVAEGIPVWRADQLAVALGVHPSAIWPDWFDRVELAS